MKEKLVIAKSTNFLQPFLNEEVTPTFKGIPAPNWWNHQCDEIEPVEEDDICINMQEVNDEIMLPEIHDSIEQWKQNKYQYEDVQQSTSYVHRKLHITNKWGKINTSGTWRNTNWIKNHSMWSRWGITPHCA